MHAREDSEITSITMNKARIRPEWKRAFRMLPWRTKQKRVHESWRSTRTVAIKHLIKLYIHGKYYYIIRYTRNIIAIVVVAVVEKTKTVEDK